MQPAPAAPAISALSQLLSPAHCPLPTAHCPLLRGAGRCTGRSGRARGPPSSDGDKPVTSGDEWAVVSGQWSVGNNRLLAKGRECSQLQPHRLSPPLASCSLLPTAHCPLPTAHYSGALVDVQAVAAEHVDRLARTATSQ